MGCSPGPPDWTASWRPGLALSSPNRENRREMVGVFVLFFISAAEVSQKGNIKLFEITSQESQNMTYALVSPIKHIPQTYI